MALLEIDSVNFSYGAQQILSGIYLKVQTGEVVGFLGRNGCGKSTLLKVLFGTLRGESQSVRIDGQFLDVPFTSGKIKYLTQEFLFPGRITPALACELYQADIDQILIHAEAKQYFHHQFNQLSGGIAKFLETLIVLHSPGDFVLLDEPFSYLAPVLTDRLIELLADVKKQKGVLMTDHQYHSILRASDRLYLLQQRHMLRITSVEMLRDYGYVH